MRHTMRALLSGMLAVCCCCQATAEEKESGFWIFGQKAEIKVAQPSDVTSSSVATDSATTAQAAPTPDSATTPNQERRWMLNSPLAKVSWPRVQMPKPKLPPSPFPSRSDIDKARNSWVEPSPDPAKPSPLQAMKQGASRVKLSTRNAWDKTVDVFKPGEPTQAESSRVARGNNRPFWKRMLFVEPIEPEGPQTVTEWMAQDRVDP
jgi:hypothetical protein